MYGLAHVDRSGRVADQTVTGALGWRGGDRLTLTAEAGVVVIRRDPSGLVTLPPGPADGIVRPDAVGRNRLPGDTQLGVRSCRAAAFADDAAQAQAALDQCPAMAYSFRVRRQ